MSSRIQCTQRIPMTYRLGRDIQQLVFGCVSVIGATAMSADFDRFLEASGDCYHFACSAAGSAGGGAIGACIGIGCSPGAVSDT